MSRLPFGGQASITTEAIRREASLQWRRLRAAFDVYLGKHNTEPFT